MKLSDFSYNTQVLYKGDKVKGCEIQPESAAIFLTSAFDLPGDLDDVNKVYESKGYGYIRGRNPNRHMLADKITFLEGGEDSVICSAGMGVIITTLFTFLKGGDHILASDTLYGESLEFIEMLEEYGIEHTFVRFSDLDAIKAAIRPNTKMVYSETISNPSIDLMDVEEVAKVAHANGALLVLDNTFGTPFAMKVLEMGADLSINSMTKFINGHSDALLGSVTGSHKLIDQILPKASLMGTTGGTFSTWLVNRSMLTLELRIKRQMENAAKIAAALEKNPHVNKVFYPTASNYAKKELVKKVFKFGYYGAMLSFQIKGDRPEVNTFMKNLTLVHYAPTLGGVRTTMANPYTSSHRHLPQEMKDELGITPGLIRLSVGIEDANDLIADLNYALNAIG